MRSGIKVEKCDGIILPEGQKIFFAYSYMPGYNLIKISIKITNVVMSKI